MGMEKRTLDMKRYSLFGGRMYLRAVTTLPGVKTVGEASTGFNVRGGSADQNLILFNDATIFNPSPLRFLLCLQPRCGKDVELYKAAFLPNMAVSSYPVLDDTPAVKAIKRILQVLPVLVCLPAVLILKGPGIRDKMYFIWGGRTTHANWLLKNCRWNKHSRTGVHDVNLLLSCRLTLTKDNLYFTGYLR